jgi:CheY-like chemotaxis protein
VLTDVMMPRLDGFGLLRQLRSEEATRGIPVVMVSARAGAEAAIGGLDAGADDYLIKPFTAAELIARVRTQLRTGRQRSQAATRIQALSDITRQLNTSLDPGQISQVLTRNLVPAYAGSCSIRLADDTGSPPARPPHATGTRGSPHAASRPSPVPATRSTDDRLMLPMTSRGRSIGVDLHGGTLTRGLLSAHLDSGGPAPPKDPASRKRPPGRRPGTRGLRRLSQAFRTGLALVVFVLASCTFSLIGAGRDHCSGVSGQ